MEDYDIDDIDDEENCKVIERKEYKHDYTLYV